jgi:hypothetical protein
MLQNVLDAMNPAQRNAATSDARVLQILAGPGSGKTRGKYANKLAVQQFVVSHTHNIQS